MQTVGEMCASFSLDEIEYLLDQKLTSYRAAVVDADTASTSRVDLAAHPAADGAFATCDADDSADSDAGADDDDDGDDARATAWVVGGGESIYSDRPLAHGKAPLFGMAGGGCLHSFVTANPAVDSASADDDAASFRSVASIEVDEMMVLDEDAAEALLLYLTPDDVLDFQRRIALEDADSQRALIG